MQLGPGFSNGFGAGTCFSHCQWLRLKGPLVKKGSQTLWELMGSKELENLWVSPTISLCGVAQSSGGTSRQSVPGLLFSGIWTEPPEHHISLCAIDCTNCSSFPPGAPDTESSCCCFGFFIFRSSRFYWVIFLPCEHRHQVVNNNRSIKKEK